MGAPAPQENGELPGFTGVGDVNGVFSLIEREMDRVRERLTENEDLR